MSRIEDLPALHTLVHVVELRSLAGAAERLGITPSAVSRRLARLEEALGVRLVERTTRRVRATDAGGALVHRVRPLFEALGEAEDEVRAQDEAPSGRVRVSATPAFGRACLVPCLADLAGQYPGIDFEVVLTGRRLDFVEDDLDLAVREGPLRDSALVARRLGHSAVWACAAPQYLARNRRPRRLEDLARHDLIVVPAAGPATDVSQLRGPGGKRLDLVPKFVVDDLVSVVDLAERGCGIALLPDYLAEPARIAGRLVRLLPRARITELPISLLYPERRYVARRIRLVRDAMIERWAGAFPIR